jgi:multidrug efflux pump subunit AcrA (membrane-fusion protein)
MKNGIMKLLSSPKTVIAATFVVASIVGVISYTMHRRALSTAFANIEATSTPALGTDPSASQDLTLAFPVGGRIKSVFVKTGDMVTAGTVLAALDSENAIGAINQAKGAYVAAQTAYQKLLNGASTPDIDVARVALANAQNTYTTTVAQQKVLVTNAFGAMMNSGIVAVPTVNGTNSANTPIISGTYTGTEQGTYTIKTYSTGSGIYFSVDGLESGGGVSASTVPSPLGSRGLFIQFSNSVPTNTTWTVTIPNTEATTYLANYNAYQSALQNQSQAVSAAQGAVDTAQAALNQKLASARSEDLDIAEAQVESTQGALQIAQGAYNNTLITAPTNGKIVNVSITAGQIAMPNTPAIELVSQ